MAIYPFAGFGFFSIDDDFPNISPIGPIGGVDWGDVIGDFLAINKFS